jgi:hypothetical protein
VPMAAASEHGEASRDLPVAKEVEQRGLLERFKTRRIVPRIAGEFSFSAGFFFAKPPARVRAVHVGRLVFARAAHCWAVVARFGPRWRNEFPISLRKAN